MSVPSASAQSGVGVAVDQNASGLEIVETHTTTASAATAVSAAPDCVNLIAHGSNGFFPLSQQLEVQEIR